MDHWPLLVPFQPGAARWFVGGTLVLVDLCGGWGGTCRFARLLSRIGCVFLSSRLGLSLFQC